jgi:hypothetical protein
MHTGMRSRAPFSQFVFIGRNLPTERLEAEFRACEAGPLRFNVGDTVMCNVGTYKRGTILKLWDDGNAYQIKIERGGDKVWAPIDEDTYVKALASGPVGESPQLGDSRFATYPCA